MGFTEHESLDKTLLSSSSYFSCDSDQPPASTPSCEVVPVICHLKMTGNNKGLRLEKTLDVEYSGHVSETNKNLQDNNSFFESSQSKHDKTENSGNDIPNVVAEEVEMFNSSCKIGQLQSSGPQIITALRSNIDNKDQCVDSAYTSGKHLSPEADCRKSAIRCVSDVDSVQSVSSFESEKHVPVPEILSDTFSDQKSHNTTDNNFESRSHAFCQNVTVRHKRQANLGLDHSSNTDTNITMCEKRTFDLNMGQNSVPTSEFLIVKKVAMGKESETTTHTDCCEFSRLRKDCVNAYEGHLRYHCLPDSNDSDSDETCPGPNVDVEDSSVVLDTIDMAEVLLSTRERLMSESHSHLKTRRFQCSVPECEKAFSQRGSLNRHMRSHLGIRPYSCPFCNMTFSRQYRVTEHMRVHQRRCDDPT